MSKIGAQRSVSVGTASGLFLEGNARRYGVVISSPGTNPVTISNTNPAAANVGITLRAATPVLVVTIDDVGDWLRGALYAIAVGGSETLGVVECLEP